MFSVAGKFRSSKHNDIHPPPLCTFLKATMAIEKKCGELSHTFEDIGKCNLVGQCLVEVAGSVSH